MVPAVVRPLLRPLPLASLSAGFLFATTLASSKQSKALTTMSSSPNAIQTTWPTKAFQARHTSWPYNPSDFTRQDEHPDASFYSAPRFVTHIDDAAIRSLREYYDVVLPRRGRILDFCSSWVSHYPRRIEEAVEKGEVGVVGMGMNKAELEKNAILNQGRVCVDLNGDPDIPAALREGTVDVAEAFDAATCVVSIDYLTKPVEVLRSLREVVREGGCVHLIVSNRCFPTKAVSRWLRVGEEERLMMVGDFLNFAGWKNIEIVELSDGTTEDGGGGGQPQAAGLQGLMAWMGMNRRDPLWVVRAMK